MQQRTLEGWLAWMEVQHPRQIELGLERVAAVAAHLTVNLSGVAVITVGGTNGKGSCVAFLDAILRAQGYRVGTYTSPHLLRYNERICIDGTPVDDAQLCAAFEAVAAAQHGISLTYFEFGTLAALWLLQRAALDVIVLEVGLGGRLDAVNIIDANVAVLTTIDLDHQDWLGFDRESIGFEKAGIYRAQVPAICADPEPPRSVVEHAHRIDAQWYPLGNSFTFSEQQQTWDWHGAGLPHAAYYQALPLPSLPLPSAAAALAALQCLSLSVSESAIRRGIAAATLPGRFQQVQWRGVDIILDVAHNPQAARSLTARLQRTPRYTRAVFAIMSDKDVSAVIEALATTIDHWHLGDLIDNARALDADALASKLRAQNIFAVSVAATIAQTFSAALQQAKPGERVVVFGSFFTVAAVLAQLQQEGIVDGDR